ncbi:hypothetical protein MXB_2761, partial [Myxobolus squamalis]
GTKSAFVCVYSSEEIQKNYRQNLTFSNLHNFQCKSQYNCLKTCNHGWSGEQCNKRICISKKCGNNNSNSLIFIFRLLFR